MKRTALSVAGDPGRKRQKTTTPKIYERLIREVEIATPLGYQRCSALFDTGANIFVLDEQWAAQFHISYIERDVPLEIYGFSGQRDESAGRRLAPFLTLKINQHESTISTELGTLEDGIDLIIPGGWFLVEHPMTFDKGKVKAQKHVCQPLEEITYDNTLLDDTEAITIGSMTYFTPPDHAELKKIIQIGRASCRERVCT